VQEALCRAWERSRGSPCPAPGRGSRGPAPARARPPAATRRHHWQSGRPAPFLGVHADDRLASGQVLLGLLVDVAKLRVSVGVLGALLGLEGALQRVALLLEQPPDGVVADLEPLRAKRVSELTGGLARPPQRRLRSPRVSGSTSSSNACSRPGWRSTTRLGPPPERRMRPRGSGGASSSRTPAYTVGRDSPLIRAMRTPPPCPSARAAVPASRRRCFSVRWGRSARTARPTRRPHPRREPTDLAHSHRNYRTN
jgi:hypothetical protein